MKKQILILLFACFFSGLQAQTSATALNFDGINDYVNITNQTQVFNYDASSTFTIEFWIKPSDKLISQTIIGKGRRTAGQGFIIRVVNNMISFRNRDVIIGNTTATAISPTAWSHVAVTYNASAVTIYINGVSKVTGTLAINPISNTLNHKLFIGARRADNGSSNARQRHFKGELDDIRFWNIVRPASDISTSYTCEVGAGDPGLVSNFKFNQGFNNQNNGTETTLISTNTAYNGTLNQFALNGLTSNYVTATNILASCAILSVAEDELALNINLFPNPSHGKMTLLNTSYDKLDRIELIDMNGKTINIINTPIEIGSKDFDFSHLASGVYFMKIKSEKASITKKIVIE